MSNSLKDHQLPDGGLSIAPPPAKQDQVRTFEAWEFHEHQENNMGFCAHCMDITTECVEPDAEGYECERCERPAVMGLEQALIVGLILVREG